MIQNRLTILERNSRQEFSELSRKRLRRGIEQETKILLGLYNDLIKGNTGLVTLDAKIEKETFIREKVFIVDFWIKKASELRNQDLIEKISQARDALKSKGQKMKKSQSRKTRMAGTAIGRIIYLFDRVFGSIITFFKDVLKMSFKLFLKILKVAVVLLALGYATIYFLDSF